MTTEEMEVYLEHGFKSLKGWSLHQSGSGDSLREQQEDTSGRAASLIQGADRKDQPFSFHCNPLMKSSRGTLSCPS